VRSRSATPRAISMTAGTKISAFASSTPASGAIPATCGRRMTSATAMLGGRSASDAWPRMKKTAATAAASSRIAMGSRGPPAVSDSVVS
jgi:hypothetical protein